jgi:hypothetical protein
MKTLISILFSITLLFSSTVRAQDAQSRLTPADVRANDFTQKMTQKLKLTTGQQKRVHEINLWAAQKMDGYRSKYFMNVEGLVAAGREIDRQRDLKLQDVLEPGQWAKYQRLKKKQFKEDRLLYQNEQKEIQDKRNSDAVKE